MLKKFLVLIIVAMLSYSLLSCNEKVEASDTKAEIAEISKITASSGGSLPDFFFTKDGKEVSFTDVSKGKVVLLNFWATWCPPCRAEIPDIIEIQNELKSKNFLVVGVALERNPNNAKKLVSDYASKQGINYPNYVGSKVNEYASFFNVQNIPSTFIIKDGKVVESIIGMRSKEQFMQLINKHM